LPLSCWTGQLSACPVAALPAALQVQSERLGRGLVAVAKPAGKVFVSWRLLLTDAPGAAFDVYRLTGTAVPDKLNAFHPTFS
jgi:rhamnogalacturonan endolyase